MKIRSRRRSSAFSVAFALLAVSGCEVLSIEEDRALRERQSESFDAERYVSGQWDTAVLPELEKRAVEFAELHELAVNDLRSAGSRLGRKAGDGSPWTFVAKGRGTVGAIDVKSVEGTIEVLVPTRAGTSEVLLQTGPVIVDNSIRDALPFLTFDDFPGQVAFAEVGRALTSRALSEAGPVLQRLKVGDRIEFLGTFSLAAGTEQPRITVVRLSGAGLSK